MICLKSNRFFYGLSRMLHLSEFVWILRSSVLVVFNNSLLVDATGRSKIRSDQMRFFIALSLYPLSFFANTPFKVRNIPGEHEEDPVPAGDRARFRCLRSKPSSRYIRTGVQERLSGNQSKEGKSGQKFDR